MSASPDPAAATNSFALEAYKQVVSLSNAEEAVFWTRNNVFVLLDGGLAAAAFALGSKKVVEAKGSLIGPVPLMFLLCLIGLFLSVAWLTMIRRSIWISRVITQGLCNLESTLGGANEARFFGYFRDALNNQPPLGPWVDEGPKSIDRLDTMLPPEITKSAWWRGRFATVGEIWSVVGFGFCLIWIVILVGFIYLHAQSGPVVDLCPRDP